MERTVGFSKAQGALWSRYVRGWPTQGEEYSAHLAAFHLERLRRRPNGFTGESDRSPPLRLQQIAAIQTEVAQSQRTKPRSKGRASWQDRLSIG